MQREKISSPAISSRWIMQHFPGRCQVVGGRRAPLDVLVSTSAASKRQSNRCMWQNYTSHSLCLKRKGNFTPLSPAAFFPFFLHLDSESRQRCRSSRPDMLGIRSPRKGPASPPRLLNCQQASLCFPSSLIWLLWSGFAYLSLPCALIKFYRFQLSRNVERQKSNHLSTHLYPGVHCTSW